MANNVTLDENITWTYGGQDQLHSTPQNELVIDPFAEAPNYRASWSGFGSETATTTQTPHINSAALRWVCPKELRNTPGFISDQVIVHDTVYYVSGSTLKTVDAATGNLYLRHRLAPRSYFASSGLRVGT